METVTTYVFNISDCFLFYGLCLIVIRYTGCWWSGQLIAVRNSPYILAINEQYINYHIAVWQLIISQR